MSNKSNTEYLHDEGVLNKSDLSTEHVEAIDSLSKLEVEQLKSIHDNANKDKDQPVGIFV
ncbi:hypothetical protein Q4493_09030 [Colwellia sp. 1_MG-2023]|uniref:hypothetical protein n=1 Tax=Colwellia sp. 1_MG-2023 TaxID=3062649 RepID=UPI0026E2FC6B|nr:hypothetical protein [Colwellia sp. 1_MG-2023]MDO6445913.1 hypothetical protein [Colwellia sp. 1_MG-2023]